MADLQFKLADTPAEFEAIHRLNYRTFALEIPQHAANADARLVDRFHAENTYAVCLCEGTVVGMIAGRSQRPFSLDQKLPDLARYLPPHGKVVEVRLLAVAPEFRKQRSVFARLAGVLARHFRGQGFDLALISGTVHQLPLYAHLGFVPFGPLVGSEEARYQPMLLSLARYAAQASLLESLGGAAPLCLLPGPVSLRPEVKAALAQAAVSHRSEGFAALHRSVRGRLKALGGGGLDAVLMSGSGTLANDAVAAQLSLRGGRGLILANGEFGERLIDHGRRWRLDFEPLHAEWGAGFEPAALKQTFARLRPAWVWATVCETSTGVNNPLALLKTLAAEQGADLCLDAVSAIGLRALDLTGVRLASGVSGKALGGVAGLAVVFHDGRLLGAGQLPASLDLTAYAAGSGVPFTQNSSLLAALDAALQTDWPQRWAAIAAADRMLRERLRALGFKLVAANDADAMPGVLSLALPPDVDAARLARWMARAGFELAHASAYLLKRNWLQICLMGEWDERRLELLPEALARYQGRRSPV